MYPTVVLIVSLILMALIVYAVVRTVKAIPFGLNSLIFGNEPTWSGAKTSGVFDDKIRIDIDDKVYDDRTLKARLTYLIDMFSASKAKTSIVKAYDRTTLKDILSLNAGFTSQSTANTALDINLGANVKDNVLQEHILELGFTPTDGDYTNMVQIKLKDTGDSSTVRVYPLDKTKKIGISSGVTVPANTIISVLATSFADNSKSVDPISAQARMIENYVQIMKSPFEIGDIAQLEDTYTKGTELSQDDSDARDFLLMYGEKMLLSESPGVYKKTARLGNSDDKVQQGIMRGLIHMLKYGNLTTGVVSPAAQSYTTWSYNVFDRWQWDLFSPEHDDVADVRLLVCNKAMRKFFWEEIKAKRMYWEDTKAYGPSMKVKTVYTDAGEFDLMVHPKIHARYPDMEYPMGLALTLPMVEMKTMIPVYIKAGIQDNDQMGYKAEYRWAWTFMLHNIGTSYHGILWPLGR